MGCTCSYTENTDEKENLPSSSIQGVNPDLGDGIANFARSDKSTDPAGKGLWTEELANIGHVVPKFAQSNGRAHADKHGAWTNELAAELQKVVDRIFGEDRNLANVEFSLTIADPSFDGCPLIGCSVGFSKLCGYEMHEIVGRNCRFLVDPVPKELQDLRMRNRAREFCEAVRDGKQNDIAFPPLEPWMPAAVPGEVFCFQLNARKDGSHFCNMFYLVAVELDDVSYIIGLQTELSKDKETQDACVLACKVLNQNMTEVDKILASSFWYSSPMRRQDVENDDGLLGA